MLDSYTRHADHGSSQVHTVTLEVIQQIKLIAKYYYNTFKQIIINYQLTKLQLLV
jgi:hypothetical protein